MNKRKSKMYEVEIKVTGKVKARNQTEARSKAYKEIMEPISHIDAANGGQFIRIGEWVY